MSETLLSAGIDIGTSTTQLVLSRLTIENQANPFSVPRVAITSKELIYRSAIHFTPLVDDRTIDADGVRAIVAEEYRKAGVARGQVETGAVIITGETARKENAAQVLAALSDFAGDFVVATAGPDLESILAARGAGVDTLSKERREAVLNFDIGGGTSNLALYENGVLKLTDCLDVGGRLVKLTPEGTVTYVSPVLPPPTPAVGQRVTPDTLRPMLDGMVARLEEAIPPSVRTLSFSGGVADCMWQKPQNWLAYGDVGVLLGETIRTRLEEKGYTLLRGAETIRATVVGAGSHSTELSGSTIFYRDVTFPLKNIPILKLEEQEEALPPAELANILRDKLDWYADEDGPVQLALGLRGFHSPGYRQVAQLAEGLTEGLRDWMGRGFFPILVLEQDMAKVLGQAMAARLEGPLLCMDFLSADHGDYIDVGGPIAGGKVLPVVIKTLAFQNLQENGTQRSIKE